MAYPAGTGKETPARSIVWLASYPKSGNTWLRAVLTNYLREGGGPASINALIGGFLVHARDLFDEYVGLPSSDMTSGDILRLRPLFHELIAAELPRPTFIKVHDACLRTAAGPLFPRAATAAAIYLVRNPLDVALSFAYHSQWSVDRTVAELNSPTDRTSRPGRLEPWIPDSTLPWSEHVSSWLESELPVHVARYEDMLADPMATFGAIIRHAGLEWNPSRLAQAIDDAHFDRLRGQEQDEEFRERASNSPSFFRSGTAGAWRAVLTPAQVRSLVDAHAPVMERFGYLREAEAFLAAAGTDAARTATPPADE